MKLFSCGTCGQTVYFENVQCVRCGSRLGFLAESLSLEAVEPVSGGWRPVRSGDGLYRLCGNYAQYGACNWLVPADEGNPLCRACRLNRTIPDLSVPRHLALWRRLQGERNRLIYGLLRLGLPVTGLAEAPDHGLAFDFLADPDPPFREGGSSVVTGHAGGVITLDIAEADDAVRERVRQQMAEPYRTVLGHFRHESGHYYWERLVRRSPALARFRARFGDERASYADALARYYNQGPPPGWSGQFVSAYASAHPWEDWAESWAHYLHMVDTLETAWQLGLRLSPQVEAGARTARTESFDPTAEPDFATLIDHWRPLTTALNCLNQSMGQGDAYPFVLAPPAVAKLELVHEVVRDSARG